MNRKVQGRRSMSACTRSSSYKRSAKLACLMLAASLPAIAQPAATPPAPPQTELDKQLGISLKTLRNDLLNNYAVAKRNAAGQPATPGDLLPSALDPRKFLKTYFFLLADPLAADAVKKFIVAVDENRPDKQVGAGDSSAGTTSLVTKGSVPGILGFAVENGALE